MSKNVRMIAPALILFLIAVASGQNTGRNFPIPRFLTDEQNTVSSRLQLKMEEMAEHLCHKVTPVTPEWEARYNELLGEMIVAENAVVWAAAADLNHSENDILADYFAEKKALLDLLDRLIPEEEALRAPADKLRTGSNLFAPANNRVSRGAFIVYSQRALLADVHKDSWQTMASMGNKEYTRRMTRALKALGRVEFELYVRGQQVIEQKTGGAEFPFAIHLASDNIKDKVDVAVVQEFITSAGIRGSSASRVNSFDKEFDWKTDSGVHHVRLEGAEETRFKGQCSQQTVRIFYLPSRAYDAQSAATLLSRNSFKVDFREVSEDQILDHRQKVYYQNHGNRNGADLIARLIRNLELVDPNQGDPAQTENSPDYTFWLGKKQVPTVRKTVRIVYTANRANDAGRAKRLLEQNGFNTELWPLSDSAEPSWAGKVFFAPKVNGTEEEAKAIASIIKDIEVVTTSISENVIVKPEYVLWIAR